MRILLPHPPNQGHLWKRSINVVSGSLANNEEQRVCFIASRMARQGKGSVHGKFCFRFFIRSTKSPPPQSPTSRKELIVGVDRCHVRSSECTKPDPKKNRNGSNRADTSSWEPFHTSRLMREIEPCDESEQRGKLVLALKSLHRCACDWSVPCRYHNVSSFSCFLRL